MLGYERRLYNLHDNQNGFIWSSQHWNRCLRAAKNLYRCGNWTLRHSWSWKTPVQPPRWWQCFYLIFPALKQEFTRITQPLHLSKLNLSTLLLPKHDCTTSTEPLRKWKWHYLIFQVLKQETTSIVQPLQLWKLGFRTDILGTETCYIATCAHKIKYYCMNLLGPETISYPLVRSNNHNCRHPQECRSNVKQTEN